MVMEMGGSTPRIAQPSSNSRLGPKHVQNERSKLLELKQVRGQRAALLAEKERKHRKHEKADDLQSLIDNLAGVWKERVSDPLDNAIDSVLAAGGCFLPALEDESAARAPPDVETARRGVRKHKFTDGHKAHPAGSSPRDQAVSMGAAQAAADQVLRETLAMERQIHQRERETHKGLTRIRIRTNGIRASHVEEDGGGEAEDHEVPTKMGSTGCHGG
mmetsp:Transcript_31082/g.78237  ORF Transcript_31082/g.78237 Transcript_31082/m.78237 type:complete len:217 (+) Transcript_31082:257-907(+)